MAELHLKAGGTATAPYDTWAKSLTTIAAAIAAMAAGDTLYMTSAYAESAAGMTVTLPGTDASPVRLIGGTEGATSGLTALADGATLESTSSTITIAGTGYIERLTIKSTTTNAAQMSFANATGNAQKHRDCLYWLNGTNTASRILFGVGAANSSATCEVSNPSFRFGNASQRISVDGSLDIRGGGLHASSSAVTTLFGLAPATRACELRAIDFDASGCASTLNIIGSIAQSGARAEFYRWKMPASWSGAIVASGQLKRGDRFSLIDYSVGSTRYEARIEDYAGTLTDETTIKITADDRSYKIVTTAECSIVAPMRSRDVAVALTGAGAQTITLDVCTDGVTLTDAEAFIEVEYFAASGSSLGTITTDASNSITAPAAQTTSSTTWTTAGLSSPVKQEVSVSVTAGLASKAVARLVLRKPSTTVYLGKTARVS